MSLGCKQDSHELQQVWITFFGTLQAGESLQFSCRCSFAELYNETITDLLSLSDSNLHIREDTRKGIHVEGLIQEEVSNGDPIMRALHCQLLCDMLTHDLPWRSYARHAARHSGIPPLSYACRHAVMSGFDLKA